MNKFLKAYITILAWSSLSERYQDEMQNEFDDNMDILKELVDKQIPMKVKNYEHNTGGIVDSGNCLICNQRVFEGTYYCPKKDCGQKLDWEETK